MNHFDFSPGEQVLAHSNDSGVRHWPVAQVDEYPAELRIPLVLNHVNAFNGSFAK
jgi:hypothetical protein